MSEIETKSTVLFIVDYLSRYDLVKRYSFIGIFRPTTYSRMLNLLGTLAISRLKAPSRSTMFLDDPGT